MSLYTISGLPVHALVVHFAVVLLPIATASIIVAIYVPKYRQKYGSASLIGLFFGTGAAGVAKLSGEELANNIGLPQEHARYGNILPYLAILLLIGTLYWLRVTARKRARGVDALGNGLALLGVAVIALSFLAGHTGAQAVWKNKIAAVSTATEQAKASPSPSAKSTVKSGAISMATVKTHASASSCWAVVNGNVYDLTKWISEHPGGPGVIKAICGKDGSRSFNNQHRGQANANAALAQFKIGVLG